MPYRVLLEMQVILLLAALPQVSMSWQRLTCFTTANSRSLFRPQVMSKREAGWEHCVLFYLM